MTQPPQLGRWLIGLAVRNDEKPFLLADLDEEFESIVQTSGGRAARRWYWSQVVRSWVPSFRRRLAGASFGRSPKDTARFGGLGQDIGLSLRALTRNPTYSVVVVLTLGLGMGSLAAVLSVVNSVLIEQLPFQDADELVLVRELDLEQGGEPSRVSPPNFLDWRDQSSGFVELAAATPAGVVLNTGGRAVQINSMRVSAGFFDVLRVGPRQGRLFVRDDEATGANAVAVVSHAFWRQQFGDVTSDPAEPTIVLDGTEHRIVGVLPEHFRYMQLADIWLPMSLGTDQRDEALRGARYLDVIGRRAGGMSMSQVSERFAQLAEEMTVYPNNRGWTVLVRSLHRHVTADIRLPLTVLAVAVGFVVLVVAANIVTLVMARAIQQWRQFALRRALGAGFARLFRQALVEHVIVISIGVALGCLLAVWAIEVLVAVAPLKLPSHVDLRFDGFTVLVVSGVSIVLAVLLTVVSMFVSSRLQLGSFLRTSHAHSESKTVTILRNLLVVSEIAICLMLLIGATLLTQSFVGMRAVDPGFETENVIVGFVGLRGPSYSSAERKTAFTKQLRQLLDDDPTIVAAAVGTNLPMSGSSMNFGYRVDGRDDVEATRLSAQYHAVSSSYFTVLGIAFRFGAPFDDNDTYPTVVINESLARRFWRDQDPVGRRLTVISQNGPVSREIVGVIANVRHADPSAPSTDEVYVPFAQDPWSFITLIAKSQPAAGMAPLVRAVDAKVRAVDPLLPLNGVSELEQLVAQWRAPLRFQMIMVGLFAGFALLLAGVGIYGVIAFFVGTRTNEIGVRMAIGADRFDILNMVVLRSVALTSLGLAAGFLGAIVLGSSIERMLFGVSPNDISVYVVSGLAVSVLSLAASIIPARRASKVDPVHALRDV